MLEMGAKNATKEEIDQLIFSDSHSNKQQKMHRELQQLNNSLIETANTDGGNLEITNAVFLNNLDLQQLIDTEFKNAIKLYNGAVFCGSKEEINQWICDKTHEKIPKFFKDDNITKGLILANTVYLKDAWLNEFNPKLTNKKGKFYTSNIDYIETPLMHQQQYYKFIKEDDYKVINLPFENQFSFVVILPDKKDGLNELTDNLTHLKKETLLNKLYITDIQKVEVTLPKFTIKKKYDLTETLTALGMKTAFTDSADFTGILSPHKSYQEVHIGSFFHAIDFSIEESGIEAAAVSVTEGEGRCRQKPSQPAEFKADHPFHFMVLHNDTKTILFEGCLSDPKS